VTEEEWTAGEDPDALLDAAKAMKRLPARKARLFAGGCFRLMWGLIRADDLRLAVDMSDARADKKIGQPELERHRYPMTTPSDNVRSWLAVAIQSLATSNLNPSYVAWQVRTATENDIYRHARRGIPCRPRPSWSAKSSATRSGPSSLTHVGERRMFSVSPVAFTKTGPSTDCRCWPMP
jgi:hypothetical protein